MVSTFRAMASGPDVDVSNAVDAFVFGTAGQEIPVVPRGGATGVSATINAASTVTILPTPPGGMTYRLQRAVLVDAGPVILLPAAGGNLWLGQVGNVSGVPGPVDNMDGLLFAAAILALNNNGAGSARYALWYDLVTIQSII